MCRQFCIVVLLVAVRKERESTKRTELGQSIVMTSMGYGMMTVVYGNQVWIVAITDEVKATGKRSAGNLHAAFERAGTGDGLTERLVRHSHRKRGVTDRSILRVPRQSSTLPI